MNKLKPFLTSDSLGNLLEAVVLLSREEVSANVQMHHIFMPSIFF